MAVFQVDRLACKRELVSMIIRGSTLREAVEYAASRGDQCSKSAVDRYIKGKLIEGHIYENGAMELREKEGRHVRVTKYPPANNSDGQAEIRLLPADE